MSWDICNFERDDWDKKISTFNQRSFHNIFNFGLVKEKQSWNVLRILYKQNESLISATQIFFKKKSIFRFINIPGGIEGEVNEIILNDLAKFIKKKFGIFNFTIMNMYSSEASIKNMGIWKKMIYSYEANLTMKKNIDFHIDDLKKSFSKNWRHNLNRSKKYNYEISINSNPNTQELLDCYKDLEKIKSIKFYYTHQELKLFFNHLKNNLIHLEAREGENLLAFRTLIFNNKIGWDFLAASNHKARKNYSTYSIMYKIFSESIKKKIICIDLSGVDPKKNLGVYNFKKGTGAKEFRRFGELVYSPSFLIRYFFLILIFLKRIFIH